MEEGYQSRRVSVVCTSDSIRTGHWGAIWSCLVYDFLLLCLEYSPQHPAAWISVSKGFTVGFPISLMPHLVGVTGSRSTASIRLEPRQHGRADDFCVDISRPAAYSAEDNYSPDSSFAFIPVKAPYGELEHG